MRRFVLPVVITLFSLAFLYSLPSPVSSAMPPSESRQGDLEAAHITERVPVAPTTTPVPASLTLAPSDVQSVAPGSSAHETEQGQSLMFVENVGQFDEQVQFQLLGSSSLVRFTDDAIWVTVLESTTAESNMEPEEVLTYTTTYADSDRPILLPQEVITGVNIKISFVGSNPKPHIEPFNRQDTAVSYFSGSDPEQWHTKVPTWGGVRYGNLYPGVDLEIEESNGEWAWRVVAADVADLEAVQLRAEGGELALEGNFLQLDTSLGEFHLPLLSIPEHSPSEPAQILNSGLATSDVTSPFATASISYPVAARTNLSSLIYGTFIGSTGGESGKGIAVDPDGVSYITGRTTSNFFPTEVGTFQTLGEADVFVIAVESDGSHLRYVSFLGGDGDEGGRSIAVDKEGHAYITGSTDSFVFPGFISYPVYNAFQPEGGQCIYDDGNPSGCWDAFVTKLTPDGSGLIYSTYLAGPNHDEEGDNGNAIAVDDMGNAFVAGSTSSWNFPTLQPLQAQCSDSDVYIQWCEDAFLSKFSSTGELLFSTYLGGSDGSYSYWSSEYISDLAVDSAGNVYFVGTTAMSNFPTHNPLQPAQAYCYDGDYSICLHDAVLGKINSSGTELLFGTHFGGSGNDWAGAIAVDDEGYIYVAGETSSSDLPTQNPLQPFLTLGGCWQDPTCGDDAFVAKLNPDWSDLVYSTYIGGSDIESGVALDADAQGNTIIAFTTDSSDIPTVAAFQSSISDLDGESDIAVAKINQLGSALLYSTYLGGDHDDYIGDLALDSFGVIHLTGGTRSLNNFPVSENALWPAQHQDNDPALESDAFLVRLGDPLLPDMSVEQHPCPFCGNDQRAAYPGGFINSFSGNYNYKVTDIPA